MRILVSGWRFLPHSYAMVNQLQLLELVARPGLTVYHEDVPPYHDYWEPATGLFPPDAEAALRAIGPLPPGVTPDAEFRISFPYDLATPPRARRTCVFGTSEFGTVDAGALRGGVPLAEAHRAARDVVLVTPSRWSLEGFLRSGADPARVEVVPHGADTALFAPPTPDERSAARVKFGFDAAGDELVFLHVGGVYSNKGLALLLRAFAVTARRHPHARLLVKGLDALYPSKDMLLAYAGELTPADIELVQPRLRYVGASLSLSSMRQLYQAADCYVSAYSGEGFNLPVLEAAATGVAVICTSGGPTDDFTTDDFALRIASTRESVTLGDHASGMMLKPSYEHLVEHMLHVAETPGFRERARGTGPAFVRARYTWKHAVDRLLEVLKPS